MTYYIDRAGSYRTGLCTAQCAYSPEFAGRDKSLEVKSEWKWRANESEGRMKMQSEEFYASVNEQLFWVRKI